MTNPRPKTSRTSRATLAFLLPLLVSAVIALPSAAALQIQETNHLKAGRETSVIVGRAAEEDGETILGARLDAGNRILTHGIPPVPQAPQVPSDPQNAALDIRLLAGAGTDQTLVVTGVAPCASLDAHVDHTFDVRLTPSGDALFIEHSGGLRTGSEVVIAGKSLAGVIATQPAEFVGACPLPLGEHMTLPGWL